MLGVLIKFTIGDFVNSTLMSSQLYIIFSTVESGFLIIFISIYLFMFFFLLKYDFMRIQLPNRLTSI